METDTHTQTNKQTDRSHDRSPFGANYPILQKKNLFERKQK